MVKRKFRWIFLLLLVPALLLTACEGQSLGDYSEILLPDTGERIQNDADRNEEDLDRQERGNDDDGIIVDTDDDGDNGDLIILDEDQYRDDLDKKNLYWVEDLIGYTVETEDGEDVGDIQSVLIHPVSGKIHYLVLDIEDDLDDDLDDEYVLVPWNAVVRQGNGQGNGRENGKKDDNPGRGKGKKDTPPGHLPWNDDSDPQNCLVTPGQTLGTSNTLCLAFVDDGDDDYDDGDHDLVFRFDERILLDGPSFSDEDLDGDDWEDGVDGFWRGHVNDLPEKSNRSWRYVRVGDEDIRLLDRDGDRLGEVTGLLFHMPSGQVNYAVLNTGSLFNPGDGYVVVPYSRLDWIETEDAFALSFDADRLDRLPRYDREDDLPVVRDRWLDDDD